MGCHESRGCSRDSYPESYITNHTIIRTKDDGEEKVGTPGGGVGRVAVLKVQQDGTPPPPLADCTPSPLPQQVFVS